MTEGGKDKSDPVPLTGESKLDPDGVNPFESWADACANTIAGAWLALYAFIQACRSPTVLKTLAKYAPLLLLAAISLPSTASLRTTSTAECPRPS